MPGGKATPLDEQDCVCCTAGVSTPAFRVTPRARVRGVALQQRASVARDGRAVDAPRPAGASSAAFGPPSCPKGPASPLSTTSDPPEILFLISLIVLNGVFAMSGSRSSPRVGHGSRSSPRRATARRGGDQARRGPDPLPVDSQIGITSIGVLNGIVEEAALLGRSPTGLRNCSAWSSG